MQYLFRYNSFPEKSGSLIKNLRSLNGLLFPAVVFVSLGCNQNINLKSVHSKFLSHIAVVWVSYVNGPGFFQGFSLL